MLDTFVGIEAIVESKINKSTFMGLIFYWGRLAINKVKLMACQMVVSAMEKSAAEMGRGFVILNKTVRKGVCEVAFQPRLEGHF